MWFAYIGTCFIYMYFKDKKEYINMATYIFSGCILALIIFTIFPTGMSLRPINPGKDIFGMLCSFIYSADTPTNVCPSLHVAYSLAIVSVMWKDEHLSKPFKVFVTCFSILVCLSTAFVKQHSAVDIFAALPVVLLGEILIFGKSYWLPRLRRVPAR